MTPMDKVGWAMQAFLPVVVYLWYHMPKDSYENCEMLNEYICVRSVSGLKCHQVKVDIG